MQDDLTGGLLTVKWKRNDKGGLTRGEREGWKASRLAFTEVWSWMLVVRVWNPSTHAVEPELLVTPSLKEPR